MGEAQGWKSAPSIEQVKLAPASPENLISAEAEATVPLGVPVTPGASGEVVSTVQVRDTAMEALPAGSVCFTRKV